MNLHLRWMIRRDMAEVLAIEAASFASPWSEDDFIRCLRQKDIIGMVAVDRDVDGQPVVGYMIYELHRTRLELLNLAVEFCCRRRGVGRAMVNRLREKLSNQRRRVLAVNVPDANLAGQLFLHAMGFRCVEIVFHREDGAESYRFEILSDSPTAKATT